ncbi:papain-like cysteine protease family protein [Geodermatophilus sp. SYSU D00766]
MPAPELVSASSTPYRALLWELDVAGRLIRSKQLDFTMQAQTESNWCWAATSRSVSHFYWFLSPWTQCRVANAELARTDCCGSPAPTPCNVPWYLDRALTRTRNFVRITGPVAFSVVRAEIDAGRPVGARIGWSGGGGHFMCIYGYSTVLGQEYVDIDDPIYGKSHLTVADFSTNYQGSGTWTHTYFTKRYSTVPIRRIPVQDSVMRRIWEARSLLRLKTDVTPDQARQSATDTSPSLGLAQPVFVVGLDALAGEQDATGTAVGLRVYETAAGLLQAFYDVDEGEDGRIRQMSASAQHLEPFARALDAAVQVSEQQEGEAELRLYRVPALNFEALWLHYEEPGHDQLVPITGLGPIPAGVAAPFGEAVGALREAARPLIQMDDTMGA